MKGTNIFFALLFMFFFPTQLFAQSVSVQWKGNKPKGWIEVRYGKLEKLSLSKGKGKLAKNNFEFTSEGEVKLDISLAAYNINYGSLASVVTINMGKKSFSFFLRDVNKGNPIYIPECQVIVTEKTDLRSYTEIEKSIREKGNLTNLEKIEKEPEESYDKVAASNRNQTVSTWLGLSRDVRIFEVANNIGSNSRESDFVSPRNASSVVKIKEFNNNDVTYAYLVGRGQGVEQKGTRRLENGVLPILQTTLTDEDIIYTTTNFVSLESSPLNASTLEGTHFLVSDYYSSGNMFTSEQQRQLKPLLKLDSAKKEETAMYYRAEALNTAKVPRYAFFKTVKPGYGWWDKNVSYHFNRETGMTVFSSGRVCAISKLNGKPMPDEEMAVLLQPGEKALFEFILPHTPISQERAVKLSNQSFELRLAETIKFWNNKLDQAATIHVPEKRIEEMMQAGLLHLDLITYGQEPNGTLAPSIGIYSPIGTESAPIIQYYCSMGLKDEARRSLQYFLDKQHEDGLIQNFNGYMVETGAALWSIGEYYRYTKDDEWIKKIEPKLLKSCDYLLKWREKNMDEKLRKKGYGMIDGKVADPEDPYHQYMLNAYAYLGMIRVAEMLRNINPSASKRLNDDAGKWKSDIRESLEYSLAHGPVIPMGNGAWCPTLSPWTESVGAQMLHGDTGNIVSHGTVTVKDALIGPMYLVFCEVLEPADPISKMILNYHSELMLMKNVALSQPYYTRNDWLQLKLGMVKPFLKTFYNTFPALADRQTYTFYEHLHQISTHKTHEEAWFLMQTRWMLYMEDRDTLKLLPGVPRAWLEDGKSIGVKNALTYFGPLSFTVSSKLKEGIILAEIECSRSNIPNEVKIRIPHPEGKKPLKISGGVYDEKTESVIIKPFNGKASLKLEYK